MPTYNVTVGTDVTDFETLAVAQAAHALADTPVDAISGVTTHGGGDQQYGVSLLVKTDAPASAFDGFEAVEVV